ncbi:MAG: MFS transporter [Bacteroidales bacterium]|nr:MFS transporter [Bacteroidales bacterium]
MESKSYSVPKVFVAACAGIAIFGVIMLALGAIMNPLTLRLPQAVTLPQFLSIGIILGTIFFGPVVDKFGYKGLMIAASVLALGGLLGLANFEHMGPLRLCMIVLGIGGGILNGATNALVSDIYEDPKRGRMMSIMSAFYCVGALCWTLACSFIDDYTIPLTVASVLIVLFIVYFCCISFPKAKPQGQVGYTDSIRLLRYPVILLFSLVLFFQSGLEAISGNYTAMFLTKQGLDPSMATLALTLLTVGMLIGRVGLSVLMGRFKDVALLAGFLVVALLGALTMYFADASVILPYVSTLLLGIGVSATFPVILARVGSAFSRMTGSAISIAMFLGLCGNYSLNFVAGRTFQAGSSNLFPVFLILAVVLMLAVLPIATRVAKNFTEKNN